MVRHSAMRYRAVRENRGVNVTAEDKKKTALKKTVPATDKPQTATLDRNQWVARALAAAAQHKRRQDKGTKG